MDLYYDDGLSLSADTTLTIGTGVTIDGQRGFVGGGTGTSVIVQGTVDADTADIGPSPVGDVIAFGTGDLGLTVDPEGWTNQGTLQAANGGLLNLQGQGSWSGAAMTSAGAGSTINVQGSMTDSGAVTLGSVGTGVVNLQGTIANSGGTLTLSGTGLFSLSGTITGGTVSESGGPDLQGGGGTLDGVTLAGDLDLTANGAGLTITDGLTLDATATLGGAGAYGALNFAGTQELGGTGTITFAGAGYSVFDPFGEVDLYYEDGLSLSADTTLTISTGVTIDGQRGFVGGGTGTSVIVQGTVDADTADIGPSPVGDVIAFGTGDLGLTVDPAGWTNQGTLQAANGGLLNLQGQGTWSGAAMTSAGAGSTINVQGSMTDSGVVTLGSVGTGVVNLQGTIANSGGTLTLSGTGLFSLSGTITGGTVSESGAPDLQGGGGTLDGVTLAGDLDLTANGASLTVTDGLTLDATVTLGGTGAYGALNFAGTQELGGTGTITFAGAGYTVYSLGFGYVYYEDGLSLSADTTLTIGTGVTTNGQRGFVGGGTGTSIIVQGTVDADTADIGPSPAGDIIAFGTSDLGLTLDPAACTNHGMLQADNGGLLNLQSAQFTDTGVVAADGTSTLNLDSGSASINSPGVFIVQPAATVNISGSLVGNTTDADLYQPQGTVNLNGSGTSTIPQFLEAMSDDLGNISAGFHDNFAYNTLAIGSNDYVRLVDLSDNSGSSSPEALYVNTLIVPSGSTLDLNGLHLYYRAAEIDGTITAGSATPMAGGGPVALNTVNPGNLQVAGEVDDWSFFGLRGRAGRHLPSYRQRRQPGSDPAVSELRSDHPARPRRQHAGCRPQCSVGRRRDPHERSPSGRRDVPGCRPGCTGRFVGHGSIRSR